MRVVLKKLGALDGEEGGIQGVGWICVCVCVCVCVCACACVWTVRQCDAIGLGGRQILTHTQRDQAANLVGSRPSCCALTPLPLSLFPPGMGRIGVTSRWVESHSHWVRLVLRCA